MAFVLTSTQFLTGLQANSGLLLQALRQFATVSPFTIANARTQLETSQIQPFDDDAFNNLLSEIYNLELDETLLTASELTVLNVIRAYLDPPAKFKCCGTDSVTAPDFTKGFADRVGSATFEKEAFALLNDNVTCDVYDVQLTLTPGAGAPALVVATVILDSLGCVGGQHKLSKLWIDFVSSPTGFLYDLQYNFRDDTGSTIATLFDTITF